MPKPGPGVARPGAPAFSTRTDLAVIIGLANGRTYRQIAAALAEVGEFTTENALKLRAVRLRRAVGAVDAANLISICYERHIIVPSTPNPGKKVAS